MIKTTTTDWFEFPVNVGGWHWWNIDTGGVGNGGYGSAGFRGTYAYCVIGQPSATLDDGSKIGGFVFFAGRDGDPYRTFYSRNFWFLEGYASYPNDDLGTLKGGLINNKFGLVGYIAFIGTAPKRLTPSAWSSTAASTQPATTPTLTGDRTSGALEQ